MKTQIQYNPSTGEIIGSYPYDLETEVERKLQSIYIQQKIWSRLSFAEKSLQLLALADLLKKNVIHLAQIMAQEMGKPIAAGQAEVFKCAKALEFYAADEKSKSLESRIVPGPYPLNRLYSEPIGNIFGIMPWNYPLWQLVRLTAPQWILGNGIVGKGSDLVVLTSRFFAELVAQTKLPFENLAISHEQSERVIADPRVVGVSFTGSVNGGRKVAQVSGYNLKKCVLELGGSDAYIILDDADLEKAVAHCAQARLINSGQSCIAAKRFFVPSHLLDLFLDLLKIEISKFIMGLPNDLTTQLGPLAAVKFKNELQKFTDSQNVVYVDPEQSKFIQQADTNSAYFATQIVMGNNPREEFETFGPVFCVYTYKNMAEVVSAVNDSIYGLGAAIFSGDAAKAQKLALELQVGMVAINDFIRSDPALPFGGLRASGFGRELGPEGWVEFANQKWVGVSS